MVDYKSNVVRHTECEQNSLACVCVQQKRRENGRESRLVAKNRISISKALPQIYANYALSLWVHDVDVLIIGMSVATSTTRFGLPSTIDDGWDTKQQNLSNFKIGNPTEWQNVAIKIYQRMNAPTHQMAVRLARVSILGADKVGGNGLGSEWRGREWSHPLVLRTLLWARNRRDKSDRREVIIFDCIVACLFICSMIAESDTRRCGGGDLKRRIKSKVSEDLMELRKRVRKREKTELSIFPWQEILVWSMPVSQEAFEEQSLRIVCESEPCPLSRQTSLPVCVSMRASMANLSIPISRARLWSISSSCLSHLILTFCYCLHFNCDHGTNPIGKSTRTIWLA